MSLNKGFFRNRRLSGAGTAFTPTATISNITLSGNDLYDAFDGSLRTGSKTTRNYTTISLDVSTNLANTVLCLDYSNAVGGDFDDSNSYVYFVTDANGNASNVSKTLSMDTSYGDKEIIPVIKSSPEGDAFGTGSTLYVFAVEGPNITVPGSNVIIDTQNGYDDITYKGKVDIITTPGNNSLVLNSIGAMSSNVYAYVFNTDATGNNKSYYSTTSNVYTITDCDTYYGNATTGDGDQISFVQDPNFRNVSSGLQEIRFENVPAGVSHLTGTYYVKPTGVDGKYFIYTNSGGSNKLITATATVDVTVMQGNSDSSQYIHTANIGSIPTGLSNSTGLIKVLAIGGGGAGNVAGGGAGEVVAQTFDFDQFVPGTYTITVGDGGNVSVSGDGYPLPSDANSTLGSGFNTVAFANSNITVTAGGGSAGDITQGGKYGGNVGAQLNSTSPSGPNYGGYDHQNNYVAPPVTWGSAGASWASTSTFAALYADSGWQGKIPTSGPGVTFQNSKLIREFDFTTALKLTWDVNPTLNLSVGSDQSYGASGAGSGLDKSPYANTNGIISGVTNVCPAAGRLGGGSGYSTNTNSNVSLSCSAYTSTNGTSGTGGGGGGTLVSRNETTLGGSGAVYIRYPYAQFRFVSLSNIA